MIATVDVIDRCDTYLDAAPRTNADTVEVSGFTLFLSRSAWPYYARPSRVPGSARDVTLDDVRAAVDEQDARGLTPAFEWIDECAPSMFDAVNEAGLEAHRYPLLILRERVRVAAAQGLTVRLQSPDDPTIAASRALLDVAFRNDGTEIGEASTEARDQVIAERDPALDEHLRRRIAAGYTLSAVAEDADAGPVGSGAHQPVRDLIDGQGSNFSASEVVGVGTLPAWRRRGIGAALTALLVSDAIERFGCDLILLTASDDAVARVYESVGFERVGYAGQAERA